MKDLDALKQELAHDGRLQRLQAIADSTDGQRFADALDAQKIEQAAARATPSCCGRSSRRCSARTRGSVWPEK